MQALKPAPAHMARKVALTSSRAGSPKEMLERPMLVAMPSLRHQRMVSKASLASSVVRNDLGDNSGKKVRPTHEVFNYTWKQILKTPPFYIIWTMFVLSSSAGVMMIGHLASIATQQASITNSAYIVSILAISNASGRVGGGMLSINRFVKAALEIYADDVETAVVMSGVPITNKAVKYTKFTPVLPQIQFEHLVALTNPQDVTIYLPEVYAIDFIHQLLPTQTEWLYRRGSLRIVIMNQNNDFMPSSEDLQKKFLGLTTDISIAAGHQTYATQAQSNRYGFPVKN